MAKARLRFCC